MTRLREEYFDWLYTRIKGGEYSELLKTLYNIDFVYCMAMDENRHSDGVDLRYVFARENRISRNTISQEFDDDNCSILEVMVALAVRIEDTIVGDKASEWFSDMVKSLQLDNMTDEFFDYDYVSERIDIFLNRYYDSEGRGSLFHIPGVYDDMRDLEIWYQMYAYLDYKLGI